MNNYNREKDDILLDLRGLFKVLWQDKYWIIFLSLLSIFFSFNHISRTTPVYKAEAIIEVYEKDRGVFQGVDNSFKSFAFLQPFKTSLSSFFPKISGAEFLKKVVDNNKILEKPLQKYCSYTAGNPGTLRRILIRYGVVETIEPDDQQKRDFAIQFARAARARRGAFRASWLHAALALPRRTLRFVLHPLAMPSFRCRLNGLLGGSGTDVSPPDNRSR